MEQYLKKYYHDEIINLLNDTNDRTHASLQVDLSQLQQNNFDWFEAILKDVHTELPKWDAALFTVQKTIATEHEAFLEDGYQIKVNCHVRFVHLPPTDPRFTLPFPNNDQIRLFREVKGTVVRMSQVRLLEIKREFICSKCHAVVEVEADYSLMYRFDVPKCSKAECKGIMNQKHLEPLPQFCVNFQELKIQEALSEKNIPPTLMVTIDSDLVDSCQPGDCVTICGTIERRWVSFQYGGLCEAKIAMRAVSLTREQNSLSIDSNNMSEQMITLKMDWMEHLSRHGELGMRDIILKSICPDVYGMFPVKLAIILAICSGNEISDNRTSDGSQQRGQSHVLMIGDPGLAKSKLLLSAVSVAPRAVHTTGMGCSSAGLTAAAVKEDGEWQLEAGALVLADGGICCIDEFNLMRESDRTSIHEAMEQQTISMAKAGIVCKLNTRCAILAAANPKNLHAMSEPESTCSINIGIATPLLSRFDLVFILRDERIPEWDDAIADHLLAQVTTGYSELGIGRDSELWSTQKLQAHFAAISQVQPKLTPIASAILSAYYRKCRSDPERDHARTTVRLLDSLNRLAEAHARLVFREEVTIVDAIVTIRLMESTFGFGRLVKPYDVIKEELPLGPEEEEISCILNIFDIDPSVLINETKEVQTKNVTDRPKNLEKKSTELESTHDHDVRSQNHNSHDPGTQNIHQPSTKNTKTLNTSVTRVDTQSSEQTNATNPSVHLHSEPQRRSQTHLQTKPQTQLQSRLNRPGPPNPPPVVAMDLDELDELLSFEPKTATINTNMSTQITNSNCPVQNSTPAQSTKNQSQNENAFADDEDLILSQALDDIERSQALNTKPPEKEVKIESKPKNGLFLNLGSFKFTNTFTQNRVIQEQQASKKSDSDTHPENDSAFESMSVDDSIVDKPPPKVQKLDQNRPNRLQLKFGLDRFAFKKPNKENSNPSSNQNKNDKVELDNTDSVTEHIQPAKPPTKNRIMCTPSDDESSQMESNRKLPNKSPFQLNSIKFSQCSSKSQTLPRQNTVAITSAKPNSSENDSAYDSLSSSSSISSLARPVSSTQTGKTPAMFPPSGPTQNKVDDMSFLDSLEF